MDLPIRKHSSGTWSDWKIDAHGYVIRWMSEGGKTTVQHQHRLVMEAALCRELLPGENVHHINGIKHDNRPENLELWTTQQPTGQRVIDKIDWAIDMLLEYREELPENAKSTIRELGKLL